MDRAYVSEFTLFMDRYLQQHPEVVKDQQRGWNLGWPCEIDPIARQETERDRLPDDAYGFRWNAGPRA